jgi:endonuclease III related protein
MEKKKSEIITRIYHSLLDDFGNQEWWPAESDFEVIIGAILTQNASWSNVERVLYTLKQRDLLKPKALSQVPDEELAQIIRPSGYYNQKLRKIREFLKHTGAHGTLENLLSLPMEQLRKELLGIWGIGEETADDIILYAAHKPSFVIDAYTKKIISRVGLLDESRPYAEFKELFESSLRPNVKEFKEYHALLDELAKRNCKKKPKCEKCPLSGLCNYAISEE